MIGISFSSLWKTVKMSEDRVIVPKNLGTYTAESGLCFRLGSSSIVCNGTISVDLPKDTYLISVHPVSNASYTLDLTKYDGNTETISGSAYHYEGGMNAFIVSDIVKVKSRTNVTAVITALDWADAGKVSLSPMINLIDSSGNQIDITSVSNDFPFPHTESMFQVAIENIGKGVTKNRLVTLKASVLSQQPTASGQIANFTQNVKGFGIFFFWNGNGYCTNKIYICDPSPSTCYPIYENYNKLTSLSVHGLAPVVLPIEIPVLLKFESENVSGPATGTTNCGFTCIGSFIYGIPSS